MKRTGTLYKYTIRDKKFGNNIFKTKWSPIKMETDSDFEILNIEIKKENNMHIGEIVTLDGVEYFVYMYSPSTLLLKEI